MACPSDNNSGILQLTGPIQESSLERISTKNAPIKLSLSPRSTIPALLGNQIDDITGHTCSLTAKNSKTYQLISVQICEVTHRGYQLPRQTTTPSAELILSFAPTSVGNMEISAYNGLLVCFPIYESGQTEYGGYLEQLISGSTDTKVSSLQTLFQNDPKDQTQTSLAYSTCFETVSSNGSMTSHNVYVMVFPKGIQLKASVFQGLRSRLGSFKPYEAPTAIRGSDPTLLTYVMSNGKKVKSTTSPEGRLYKIPMTSSSDEFINRFEYFKEAPTSTGGPSSKKAYKTTQYKCVPFDQLRDLATPNDLKNSYVIPEGKTLGDVLGLQKDVADAQKKGDVNTNTLTTGQIETIIGASIGIIVVGALAIYFSSRLSSNRS